MKRQETVTEEKIVVYKYCDVCGAPAARKGCKICRKDLCRNHRVADERDQGDYPDYFCKSCWEIGTKYRKQQKNIEDEADKQYLILQDKWESKALLHAKI